MRTTIDIDADLLLAAKTLARTRAVSLGKIVSELMRKGLDERSTTSSEDGFPVFRVRPGARPLTLDDVRRLDDEP